MTENLKYVLIIIHSEKPKVATMECLVPSCERKWDLEGSSQGFTKAAGMSHCYAHWRRFHFEHKHDGEHAMMCSKCIEASKKEREKR